MDPSIIFLKLIKFYGKYREVQEVLSDIFLLLTLNRSFTLFLHLYCYLTLNKFTHCSSVIVVDFKQASTVVVIVFIINFDQISPILLVFFMITFTAFISHCRIVVILLSSLFFTLLIGFWSQIVRGEVISVFVFCFEYILSSA